MWTCAALIYHWLINDTLLQVTPYLGTGHGRKTSRFLYHYNLSLFHLNLLLPHIQYFFFQVLCTVLPSSPKTWVVYSYLVN